MPLRYASTCLDGKRVPLNADERTHRQGEFPYWGANGIVDNVDDYLFDEPLVLLGEDGAPFFDKTKPVAFFVSGKIWPNNHIHVLRLARSFEPRFVTYVLNATDYGPWVDGSTRDKLTQDKMASIPIARPPLRVQQAIAEFLDHETAGVDSLIAAKDRLMILLAEKRQAIVTCAVTRGVDPNALLRDSCIPWLGEIPAHWTIGRGKWLFTERDERSVDGREILLSLRMEVGLVPHNDVSEKTTRAEELVGYKHVSAGEIVLNRMRAASGLVAVAPQNGLVSPDYAVFRCGPSANPEFFAHLFKTPLLQSVFRSESKGLGTGSSGFLRLYSEDFLSFWFPVPSIVEQQDILANIAVETAKLDSLGTATERSIALLRERRAALIAAAVTGQIDVPAAMAI